MTDLSPHIVIVGGGTAGWLCAAKIAARYRCTAPGGLHVTVIESPDMPTIGVGEGTWPSMRRTLREIGVDEKAFIAACNATFKQASHFIDWSAEGQAFYHPFTVPQGFEKIRAVEVWQRDCAMRYDQLASIQPDVCDSHRAPFVSGDTFGRGALNYAYHLDAGLFGTFLRTHCEHTLGVSHIGETVSEVRVGGNGQIEGLHLASGQIVLADLYVDCTGFAARLVSGALKAPYRSCQNQLFVDSAIAIQTPYPSPEGPIASATKSTSQRAGWIWDIGLQSRRGVGHVYSSAHTSQEEAIADLSAYLQRTGGIVDETKMKLLTFEAGYRPTPWIGNCVSLGLASGFVEPLEATSIVMTDIGTDLICDLLQFDPIGMARAARHYNDRMEKRWEGIIRFIKLHYALSQRAEPFWADNRDAGSQPDGMCDLLHMGSKRLLVPADLPPGDDVFTIDSYHYILAGMSAPVLTPAWRRSGLSDGTLAKYWKRSQTANDTFPSRYADHRRCLMELLEND